MIEDDVITRLVELHDHIQAPATPARLDALRGERMIRRRRTVSAVAAAAAVVLTVGIVQGTLTGDQRTQQPAPQLSPSPTESPSPGEEWTPERIRAKGSPVQSDDMISTESGLTTRVYQVCEGTRCGIDNGGPEDLRLALEVIQDGRSAVFDLLYSLYPWVRAFDEDSVLVMDAPESGFGEPKRYRLLQANGTATQLDLLDNPAPAVPGPGVVLIEKNDVSNIFVGGEVPYLVDDRAGTLRRLETPGDVRDWGPNPAEFLWGITDGCRVVWETGGAFKGRRLNCLDGAGIGAIHADEFPPGWLQPGRMALLEESEDPGQDQNFVHVSLDRGVTWQRIPIGEDETVADVLQRLG